MREIGGDAVVMRGALPDEVIAPVARSTQAVPPEGDTLRIVGVLRIVE